MASVSKVCYLVRIQMVPVTNNKQTRNKVDLSTSDFLEVTDKLIVDAMITYKLELHSSRSALSHARIVAQRTLSGD